MENETFKTSDLALATILVQQDFTYVLDRTSPERVIFVFSNAKEAEMIAKEYFYERTNLRNEVLNG